MRRLLLFFLLFASGCRTEVVPVGLTINRLDQALQLLSDTSVQVRSDTLLRRFGSFGNLYFEEMIRIGNPADSLFAGNLQFFLHHPVVEGAFSRVKSVFPDLIPEERALGEAFARYTLSFPDDSLPTLYSCVTGFNHSVVTAEGIVAIGLDKYLGDDEAFYTQLGVSAYQKRVMRREYMVPDVMRAMGYARFAKSDSVDNLIADMIYEGRNLWFVKQMLPGYADTLLFGFSSKQLEWCQAARQDMWRLLVEQELLFSSDRMTRIKLIQPAPYTPYFSVESPGRAAVWLGYEVVKAYVKQNPSLSLRNLMEETQYLNILNGSRFKP